MGWVKSAIKWLLSGNRQFVTIGIGYASAVATSAAIYAQLDLDFFDGWSTKTWCSAIAIMGFAVVVLAVALAESPERLLETPSADGLYDRLVESLRTENDAGNSAEVIRVGEALTRPLFEVGAFSLRLELGQMVEESAARSGRFREQYVALIDSIGWSLVEMGKYQEASRQIRHGLSVLEKQPDPFYEAKAHRHLGVVARREKRFADARDEYEFAETIAASIPDARASLEMTAGLQYALGSLAFYEGDLSEASVQIDLAIDSFRKLRDEYRLNMALVMLGDIEFRQGNMDSASDTYRHVLERSDRNRESLQTVRAILGLAEVRAEDQKWKGVLELTRRLKKIDLAEYKAERDRLSELMGRIPVEFESTQVRS